MKELNEIKAALVKEVIASLTKDFGEGIICKLKTENTDDNAQISTGNSELDVRLKGGFARGRIVELFGGAGVGKTTLALKLAAEAQTKGGLAAFIDVEHTFNRTYASTLGIDESRLWVAEPYTAEEALTICEKLIRSSLFKVVIVDSVAALSPSLESEGSVQNDYLQASLLSQALRRIAKLVKKSKTLVVFINQVRSSPVTCHFEGETTPGGMALKFLADYRLKLTNEENDFVLAKVPKF